ncbi:MAG: hypothetical protein KDC79_07620 [Cyclobacteriaceae bacterium]|nr:hypothetical protein [Cyclobacteriaceae bacterium]
MSEAQKEKKNKQIGAIVSIGSHVAILLLFLFMVAWRAPDPPLPEYGIELNFGLDEAGSGDIQPEPNTNPAQTESQEEAQPDGKDEPVEEEVTEQPKVVNTPVEQPTPITTEQESPDVVEEKPEKKVEEPVEKKEEEVKEEAPKLPPVLYPNNKTGSGGKDGDAKEAQNANQGDKTGAVGDQGDKDGTVDSRALYGNAGGGGGTTLDMGGWKWNSEPIVDEKSNESGTIVLRVVIDGKGIVQSVTTEPGTTINPIVVNEYKEAVRKITFSPLSGTTVTPSATGTITFRVKSK